MKPVTFAVVGVRNFAAAHLEKIEIMEKEGLGRLGALVVREQGANEDVMNAYRDRGVAIYGSYQELLEKGKDIEIITLPTSIPTHYDLALKGMQAGYSLILEKPPVPTIQQLDALIEVEKKTGTFCSIGFQMIHARTIRRLKEMILNGELGELREITCHGYWPRTKSYYSRNLWAGKVIVDGQLVLDGPMHNALAHYLNNMFFLAGSKLNESADLSWLRAELYRSRDFIECPDTSCLEAETVGGVRVYFYVTHSSAENVDPVLEIIGTKGKAFWNYNEQTKVEFADGRLLDFDNEGINPWTEVMRVAIQVKRGQLPEPHSTLSNSRSFVLAINGAYDSARFIQPIPQLYLETKEVAERQWTVVPGLTDALNAARMQRVLLSDLDLPWAKPSRRVDLRNYTSFNPFQEKAEI